jgi:ERCC4-type nuclease
MKFGPVIDAVLVQDSREQLGYQDLFESPCLIQGLPTGDYSILGAEHLIAIERKSLADFLGSITTGRERFEKELARGRALSCFHLVIEGRLDEIAAGNYGHAVSKVNPTSVFETLTAFSIRYNLPIWFVGNRQIGARTTESLLKKWLREHAKVFEGIGKAQRRA